MQIPAVAPNRSFQKCYRSLGFPRCELTFRQLYEGGNLVALLSWLQFRPLDFSWTLRGEIVRVRGRELSRLFLCPLLFSLIAGALVRGASLVVCDVIFREERHVPPL